MMSNKLELLLDKHFKSLRPLKVDETEVLMMLLMMNEKDIQLMYDNFNVQTHVVKALEKRVEHCLTITMDKASIMLVFILGSCIIGQCIVYLYYIQHKAKQKGIKSIDINNICTDIFPFGVLKESDLEKFWDAQKVERNLNGRFPSSDNMIDYPEHAKSLQYE